MDHDKWLRVLNLELLYTKLSELGLYLHLFTLLFHKGYYSIFVIHAVV